jgi:hypothetical protein
VSIFDRSCGSADCPIDWLASERVEVDDDVDAFTEWAFAQGWGDGLPLVPPTEARVRRHLEASGSTAARLLGSLAPSNNVCTVENAAVNAVMAGARPEAMPLITQAVQMLADPAMAMMGASTTTNAAAPLFLVSGAYRDLLSIPYADGCMGGATTPATAIGRALRLIQRNVGGERIGTTSKSVFGQPARLIGLLFGEWEERSPWPPYSERRGLPPDLLTGFVTTGTEDIVDITATNGADLAHVIGRSLAYPAQAIVVSQAGGELMLCLCPPWAAMLATSFGSAEAVRQRLWELAVIPRREFPARYEEPLAARGLFNDDGDVRVLAEPANLHLVVCGGLASLHACAFRGFGPHRVVSRPLEVLPAEAFVSP